MAVQLGLLGRLTVTMHGRDVDVGHARQRCVLAVLLLRPNELQHAGELIEQVWGETPPGSARQALRSYVSRLRGALGDVPGVGIDGGDGGYRLLADPELIDLHRFRALAAEAATLTGAARAELYEQTLGLWRGTALSGFDTPALNLARESLHVEWLTARLEQHDALLELGEHTRLLPGLRDLGAAHPLDERVTGQLMLALYRDGKQAEALREYERLRRNLADELGADPGPAVRAIHEQILTGAAATAPGTARDSSAPRRAARPVPRQLPARPRHLVGREEQLAALNAALAAEPVVTVGGAGGIGKTSFVVHWAHRHAADFPDGQLFVDLRGFDPLTEPLLPDTAIQSFVDALGVPAGAAPATTDALVGLYRSLLADKRMLIVLDNASDSGQVEPLLPGSPTCTVLVTSRHRLTELHARHGCGHVELGLLPEQDSRALVLHRVGVSRADADPATVHELVRRCAGLPLALAVVAARAATQPELPLRAIAEELRDAGTGLDGFSGGEARLDLRQVFAASERTLSAPAARVFRLLGQLRWSRVETRAVAALAGASQSRTNALLRELRDAHLINQPGPDRYRLHDLIHAYAAEHAVPAEERDLALRRLLHYLLRSTHTAVSLFRPETLLVALPADAPPVPGPTFTDASGAAAWLSAEHDVLSTAVSLAHDTGLDDLAWRLAAVLTQYLNRSNRLQRNMPLLRTALASAQRLGEPAALARMHGGLGRAHLRLGAVADGIRELHAALAHYVELDDHGALLLAHRNLAWAYELRCDYDTGLRHAREALALAERQPDENLTVLALNGVGVLCSWSQRAREALPYHRRALELSERAGNQRALADTLADLGYAHRVLAELDEATAHYKRAVGIHEDIGDDYERAFVLARIGEVHDAAGRSAAACEQWRECLAILDRLGIPAEENLRVQLHRSLELTEPR